MIDRHPPSTPFPTLGSILGLPVGHSGQCIDEGPKYTTLPDIRQQCPAAQSCGLPASIEALRAHLMKDQWQAVVMRYAEALIAHEVAKLAMRELKERS